MSGGMIKIKTKYLFESPSYTKNGGLRTSINWREKNFPEIILTKKSNNLRKIMGQLSLRNKSNNVEYLEIYEDGENTIFKYETSDEKIGLVKDPSDWTKMDGDSDIEKKINSYLTTQFITRQEIPKDECLMEAKKIMDIVHNTATYNLNHRRNTNG